MPYTGPLAAFGSIGRAEAACFDMINERGGVRRQTIARVQAAIEELKHQEQAQALTGRTYVFDVIMETPERFSTAVRQAFEQEAAISTSGKAAAILRVAAASASSPSPKP